MKFSVLLYNHCILYGKFFSKLLDILECQLGIVAHLDLLDVFIQI